MSGCVRAEHEWLREGASVPQQQIIQQSRTFPKRI
jgi:hypothetical protein